MTLASEPQPSRNKRRRTSSLSSVSDPVISRPVVSSHGLQMSEMQRDAQPRQISPHPPIQSQYADISPRRPLGQRHISAVSSVSSSSQHPLSQTLITPPSTLLSALQSSPRSHAPSFAPPQSQRRSKPALSTSYKAQPLSKKRCTEPPRRPWPRPPPPDTDTTENPSLNQDCVISYAESKPGSSEKIVRQVKCERQGWFTEDAVVVGMRFFIPA